MNRIQTAAAIETTITHLQISDHRKREKNLYNAVIQVLEIELDSLLRLGHSELSTLLEE